MSQADSEKMGNALRENKTLTSLSIFGEIEPEEGVVPVFEALKENETLQTLVLWCNQKNGCTGTQQILST